MRQGEIGEEFEESITAIELRRDRIVGKFSKGLMSVEDCETIHRLRRTGRSRRGFESGRNVRRREKGGKGREMDFAGFEVVEVRE